MLDQLCGPLCDHMLDGSGSAEVLASLERSNLFLVPLDHRRQWYRYHGLFRDLLLVELGRTEPDLIPELHRRAADWYEDNGHLDAAIEHALASATAIGPPFWSAGNFPRLLRPDVAAALFDGCPASPTPRSSATHGWPCWPPGCCALTGRPVEAVRWADAAERGSFAGPARRLRFDRLGPGHVEKRHVAYGVAAMVADAELAVSQEPAWSLWRSTALYHLFWARYVSGDDEAAEATLEDVIELLGREQSPESHLALTHRSLFAMDRGEWNAAAADLGSGPYADPAPCTSTNTGRARSLLPLPLASPCTTRT